MDRESSPRRPSLPWNVGVKGHQEWSLPVLVLLLPNYPTSLPKEEPRDHRPSPIAPNLGWKFRPDKNQRDGSWAEISFLPGQRNPGCQDGSGPELEMLQFSLAGWGGEDKLRLARHWAVTGRLPRLLEPERNSGASRLGFARREVPRPRRSTSSPGLVRVKDGQMATRIHVL